MQWIEGGRFSMGSEEFYPEERPVRTVEVEGFWMDDHPVTNGEFAAFVEDTNYVTVAERKPEAADYPEVEAEQLVAGSLVFQKPDRPVGLGDFRRWWAYVEGACWRRPWGPGSDLLGRGDHPVVHIAYEDAQAYARWADKELATEAQWEFAARGGLEKKRYTWGDEFAPGGAQMANIWQGIFPWKSLAVRVGTTAVGSFPANGYGLFDMAGNVWEWTADRYDDGATSCCAPQKPGEEGATRARHVVKGGSFLCADNHCLRYRPAARQGEAADTSTCHIGFRCVRRKR